MRFHRRNALPSITLGRPIWALAVFAVLSVATLAALPARSAGLIRDPDIEYALEQVAAPVLAAAGLGGRVRVLLVNDPSLNAFVIDTGHIYIHTGMLMRMETPEMLQSVIAHEAAHITNGHLASRMANIGNARTTAGLGMALAIVTAALTGRADAAAGLAMGTNSAATRAFLSHTRAEESSADQTGARLLARAGIDVAGAVAVHEMFRGQEALNVSRQDPYIRSHPLTSERMRAMARFSETYKSHVTPQPEIEYWFARARGKTTAFIRDTKWTLRRAPSSLTEDIRLMREAVAYHRQHDRVTAERQIDKAIALHPEDAYFWELKGQILLESRQFSRAVQAYGHAASLDPANALIQGGYGRALLATGDAKAALVALEKSRARDFRDTRVLRDLGQAYALTGNNGMASLATAERYALQGNLKDAKLHAKRASGLLPRGSGPWRRADDIISAARRAERS